MKFNHYILPCTKSPPSESKTWTSDQNLSKTYRSILAKHFMIYASKGSSKTNLTAKETRTKIKQLDYLKLKSFGTVKAIYTLTKRYPILWKRIFSYNTHLIKD